MRTIEDALKGERIRKRSVEQYLRSMGQVFAMVGTKDPHLGSDKNLDFCLARQLRSYSKEDPPPTRVKPSLYQFCTTVSDVCNAVQRRTN